jgi:hypothetical protein
MAEIGVYYVKNLTDKTTTKVLMNNTKYISIEEITLKLIIKNFLRDLKFYFFKKDKVKEEKVNEEIRNTVSLVYESYNEYCEQNNLEQLDYKKEIFDKSEECPIYIM